MCRLWCLFLVVQIVRGVLGVPSVEPTVLPTPIPTAASIPTVLPTAVPTTPNPTAPTAAPTPRGACETTSPCYVHPSDSSTNYGLTGRPEKLNIPTNGTIQISVCGAQGESSGGLGGFVQGTMKVSAGQELLILVGGAGGEPKGRGGFNGGGSGCSQGGGGLSSVSDASSKHVYLVGGGGGGSGNGGGKGGDGGLTGGSGCWSQCGPGAQGGTQTGPGGGQGACGCTAGGGGGYLQGGNCDGCGGAGGGGYYGGGGGSNAGGGGGGSSYIDPNLRETVALTGVQRGDGCVSVVLTLAPTLQPTRQPSLQPSLQPPQSLRSSMHAGLLPKISWTTGTILGSAGLGSFILAHYVWYSRAALATEALADSSEIEAHQKLIMSGLVSLGRLDIVWSVMLVLVTFTANLLDIKDLFESGSAYFHVAIGLFCVRILNAGVSTYALYSALYSEWLSRFLHARLLHKGSIWTTVSFICLLDPSQVRLLPWKFTEFSHRSGGYPNIFIFKLTLFSITATNAVMLGVAAESLLQRSSTLLSFSFSLVSFVVSIVTVIFRFRAEKIHKISNNLASTSLMWEKDVELALEKAEREKLARQVEELTRSRGKDVNQNLMREIEETKYQLREMAEVADRAETGSVCRSKPFGTNVKHADETVEILKGQVKSKGGQPLEFIPLNELNEELQQLFAKINGGHDFDERRLDYLMECMELHPEYRSQKEAERQQWREQSAIFAEACYETMSGFVPPFVFHASRARLEQEGLSKALAKRVLEKKCLWLLRMPTKDIEKLHEAELTSRYGWDGQGLDIVELAALYHHVPKSFTKDGSGRKTAWAQRLEASLQKMIKEDVADTLAPTKRRNAAYTKQIAVFAERKSLHRAEVVTGSDPYSTYRDSFLDKQKSKLQQNDFNRPPQPHLLTVADICNQQELQDHIPPPLPLPKGIAVRNLQANLSAALLKRASAHTGT